MKLDWGQVVGNRHCEEPQALLQSSGRELSREDLRGRRAHFMTG